MNGHVMYQKSIYFKSVLSSQVLIPGQPPRSYIYSFWENVSIVCMNPSYSGTAKNVRPYKIWCTQTFYGMKIWYTDIFYRVLFEFPHEN